jgi:hypothetical protein
MLTGLQEKARYLLAENASAILTAGGVAGAVGTAVLTGRASFKAAKIINEREHEDWETRQPLDKKARVLLVWPLFLPPVALGGATVASIIMANRLSAKKAAALAAAYGLSEKSFQEYREKALEKLGINQEQKLRDEVAQDRVTKHPNNEVIVIGGGEVLCYDMLTGRYFRSSVEKIKKAESKLHGEIYNHMCASLTSFFDDIGLPPTDYTEEVGWNTNNIPEVQYSTTLTPDDKPCLAISFNNTPRPDYDQLHS